MLYSKFISQLKKLAYILGGLVAIIVVAIVFNFYTNSEIDRHHSLLNQLNHVSASHSEYALRYIISPAEGLVPPKADECELGQFLLNHKPTSEELLYFERVKTSHDTFHAQLESSSTEKEVYLSSQQLSYYLGEYIKFQELRMQQIESAELSRLLAILFVSLLLCLLFSFYFTRFVMYVRQKVVVPLQNSIKILRKSNIQTSDGEEPQAILRAVEKVKKILVIDKIRKDIYPFWNSTFDKDEILEGSLKYLGDAEQIISGAFYEYDSFTDLLTLKASYAFPEKGQRVIHYGDGPVGEAVAQNKNIILTEPEVNLNLGIGTIKPSLVGCYPVCTQKMYGALVFAFPPNTSKEFLNTMKMFASQLAFVLDRVRQLNDMQRMANELRVKSEQLNTELKHKDSILQSSADGIVILTPEGRITSFSKGAEHITGYSAEEVIGKDCCDVIKHHTQDFEQMCESPLCGLCQLMNTKTAVIGKKIFIVNKKGEYISVLLTATPIFNEQGEVVEVLQIFKDLTEINDNLTKLEQASRSKTEFLATMSHELRTPLNAILGFAELLEAESFGELNDKQKRFSHNILTAGKHLLSLINDILDITRVESGKMEWEKDLIDLNALFSSGVNLLREKAAQNGIKIHLDIAPHINTFVGDERKLKQILYNLLSNAVKFTPQDGQVGIKVDQVDDELQVEVWDTGVGIPKEKWQAVFEPFYQVDSYLTRKQQGSGLGLALVKNMLSLAGGKIWLAEDSERSTVFKFTVKEGQVGVAQEEKREEPGKEENERLCVLIEDDKKTAELLTSYLEELGMTVYHTGSGTEGLNLVLKKFPDLLVLDIVLPDISGWEVLTRIKSTPAISAVPVLVVSVLDEKKKGLALGAKDYLVKPVDKRLLESCVERILHKSDVGYKALVIDDDSAALELMENYLSSTNTKVHTAMSAEDGLEKARSLKPDIIFLDLMLPQMDGFDYLKVKENDEIIAGIPVVVVTSKSLNANERSFLEERVLYIARKSDFSKENFANKVLELLKKGD
jgi:PAS domain S-box-containing protein